MYNNFGLSLKFIWLKANCSRKEQFGILYCSATKQKNRIPSQLKENGKYYPKFELRPKYVTTNECTNISPWGSGGGVGLVMYLSITRVQFVSAAYDLYVNLKSDAKNTRKKKNVKRYSMFIFNLILKYY